MPEQDDPTANAARIAIDTHGYAFQESVVRQCNALRHSCGFEFEVAEYPVELRGVETRVDLVLSLRHCLIVVECKRANPNVSKWVFAKSHYRSRLSSGRDINVDEIVNSPTGGVLLRRCELGSYGMEQFQYAFEVKDATKLGDAQPVGRARGAIEDAVTQVLRGAAGLMEALPGQIFTQDYIMVIPAIVTSAALFVTDSDMAQADLATGNISSVELATKPCLWYEHHRSASLEPTFKMDRAGEDFASLPGRMRASHSRSVAIVNATELKRFLSYAGHATTIREQQS